MVRTYVRLLCPGCGEDWQSAPDELPAHDTPYNCPHCDATRRTAEFMRTERDLETLKRLQ